MAALVTGIGNNCLHFKDDPDLMPDYEPQKRLPSVIKLLIERVGSYYNRPRQELPALVLARKRPGERYTGTMPRSEGREGIVKFIRALLLHCDRGSLHCGGWSNGAVRPLPLQHFADAAGISLWRARRYSMILRRAKLLRTWQPKKYDSQGKFEQGYPAVRVIDKSLFAMFGLSDVLEAEQKKLAEEEAKLQANKPVNRSGQAKMVGMLKSMVGNTSTKRRTNANHPGANGDEEASRRFNDMVTRIKLANPSLPWDEVRRQANKALNAQQRRLLE